MYNKFFVSNYVLEIHRRWPKKIPAVFDNTAAILYSINVRFRIVSMFDCKRTQQRSRRDLSIRLRTSVSIGLNKGLVY